jgi:uroporphyrin-III C-methyltransferase
MTKPLEKVYLVGAGCGAPDLLTLRAARAIAQATVLLVDDLVSEAILQEHADPAAQRIYVGKRGGLPSTPQAQIQAIMLEKALAGERVVRLKGGEPLIFGRAGEEIAALQAAHIPFEIISGISAAQAAAAALGVSLTHRQHARGVVFLTGHASAENHQPKWAAVAQAASTAHMSLVIYMGMSTAQTIERELLKALPASTPVAIVQNASLPHQRHAIATLGTLAQTIATQQLESPSVIIIGQVLQGLAALAATLP